MVLSALLSVQGEAWGMMVLASFGEIRDPREIWGNGHISVLPFPDFQNATSSCPVLL